MINPVPGLSCCRRSKSWPICPHEEIRTDPGAVSRLSVRTRDDLMLSSLKCPLNALAANMSDLSPASFGRIISEVPSG